MKRSGFKKKRKVKTPLEKTKDRLWELCKLIIRKKYPNECYTCYKGGLEGSNWQTGHMWPDGTLGCDMSYELAILRPQCLSCNLHYGGQGAIFYARMLEEIGEEEMATLNCRRHESKKGNVKADILWYQRKVEEYEQLLSDL